MSGSKDVQRAAPPAGPGSVVAGRPCEIPLSTVLQRVFEGLPMGVLVFDDQLDVVCQNHEAQVLLIEGENLAAMLARGSVEGAQKDWAAELRMILGSDRPRRFDRGQMDFHAQVG